MKLVSSNDPVLKQKSADWNFETDGDAKSLEVDMVKTMIDSRGIGLAANQVGIAKRVFAIHLENQVPFCMFNPTIVDYTKDSVEGSEGCLSFPDLFLKVKRPSEVSVEYFDRLGQKCIMKLKGIDARCFQHELDHLNGVCFTDQVSQLKLALAKKKQQKRKRNG
jgi:peptide deformylase